MPAVREHYLQQAKKARELADSVTPTLREDFIRVAENWEMLARHREEKGRSTPGGRPMPEPVFGGPRRGDPHKPMI